MAYQALHIPWCGDALVIKPYKYNGLQIPLLITQYVYNGLGTHGSPNITNTIVWMSAAHQTWRIQWFGDNGLRARGLPNVTYTMVLGTHGSPNPYKYINLMAHSSPSVYIYNCVATDCSPNLLSTGGGRSRTWHRHGGCYGPWLTEHYAYSGLGAQGAPNNTNTMAWIPLLTKHYVHNGLGTQGSPNNTNTIVWVSAAYQTLRIH